MHHLITEHPYNPAYPREGGPCIGWVDRGTRRCGGTRDKHTSEWRQNREHLWVIPIPLVRVRLCRGCPNAYHWTAYCRACRWQATFVRDWSLMLRIATLHALSHGKESPHVPGTERSSAGRAPRT